MLIVAPKKVPVTARALVQRINRNLAEKDRKLCAARGKAVANLGKYYVIDSYRNFVVVGHLDLEAYARELGVMGDHETLSN